jgi:hypothetical protein
VRSDAGVALFSVDVSADAPESVAALTPVADSAPPAGAVVVVVVGDVVVIVAVVVVSRNLAYDLPSIS